MLSPGEHVTATKALNLRLGGVDLETIADRLGYPDPVDALQAIEQVAAEQYDGPATDLARMLEVLRLDRLYSIAFRDALQGDQMAARLALDIGDRRQRLLRLNQRSRD